MEISAKADYAIKAIVHLASRGDLAQIGDIAAGEGIPPKFLEQILLELKKAGMVASKRGIGGGYFLAKPAENITIGEIIRIFDHSFGPVGGIERMHVEDGLTPAEQALRPSWLAVEEAVSSILNRTTIAQVVEEFKKARVGVQTVTHGTAWF